MYFPLIVGVMCLSLFCYALLCVHSSFSIILKRKRKLVALLLLSSPLRLLVYFHELNNVTNIYAAYDLSKCHF